MGFEKRKKSKFEELKKEINLSTLNFVIFSIITLGIYNLLWLYKNNQIISKKLELNFISNGLIIILSVLYAIQISIPDGCHKKEKAIALLFGLLITLIILMIETVIAFKAKTIIEISVKNIYNIELKMNGFFTFLFSLFYINFYINKLPSIVSKYKEKEKENKENIDEKIETAKNMIKDGLSIENIQKYTKLPIEKIIELKNNLKF